MIASSVQSAKFIDMLINCLLVSSTCDKKVVAPEGSCAFVYLRFGLRALKQRNCANKASGTAACIYISD